MVSVTSEGSVWCASIKLDFVAYLEDINPRWDIRNYFSQKNRLCCELSAHTAYSTTHTSLVIPKLMRYVTVVYNQIHYVFAMCVNDMKLAVYASCTFFHFVINLLSSSYVLFKRCCHILI